MQNVGKRLCVMLAAILRICFTVNCTSRMLPNDQDERSKQIPRGCPAWAQYIMKEHLAVKIAQHSWQFLHLPELSTGCFIADCSCPVPV